MRNIRQRVEELEAKSEQKKKLMLFQDREDASKYARFLYKKTESLTKAEARKKFEGFEIVWIPFTEIMRKRIEKVNRMMEGMTKE
jgi:hypothetical protein